MSQGQGSQPLLPFQAVRMMAGCPHTESQFCGVVAMIQDPPGIKGWKPDFISIPKGIGSPGMVDSCQPHKKLRFEPKCSFTLFQ